MRACAGKKLYTTFAAGKSRRARNHEGQHMQAYHCIPCQGYHYGSQVGKRIRRPRPDSKSSEI